MVLTNQQQHALALLENGWTVRVLGNKTEWRSPRGISGCGYTSTSLDQPPDAVLDDALRHQDYLVGPPKEERGKQV